ncbi:MAG TPA: MBL fold metallo-hydrolase, partial [Candidatus Nanopelagicales bacterium]|nr:MBL fold metallo-hydrolase [Candidatus Nanopelagicales bacterium]
MRVQLLGTGAADGWPNPWCSCASCSWARAVPSRIRTHTAALVDERLLIDCGSDVPRQASRAGVSLAGLEAVLLTHGHWDHADGAALLTRSWAGLGSPLQVLGPESALARVREWVGAHDPVELIPLAPGDTARVAGLTVRALPAAHGDEVLAAGALLYDVAAPEGGRLLYATDTGPLQAAALDLLGERYHLVLLEETFGAVTDHGAGHLDLASFPEQLAELRRRGAVDAGTDVIAVHLGHNNPPTPELT